MMDAVVKAGGVYCFAFVIFHLLFWRLFNWREELRSLSFLNRCIMQVLNLGLTFAFVILVTPLGKSLLVLIALFWLARALEQIVFFKLKHWGSIAFLLIFLAGALLYGIPAAYTT